MMSLQESSKKKMIEVQCGNCNETIEMYKSQWQQRNVAYCNDECRSEGMSERFSGSLNKGRTLSEEHKQKLSEAHMGKTLSKETRQKMSESTSGENAPWYGKSLPKSMRESISETLKTNDYTKSEELKQKLSEQMSGEGNPMYGKSPSWKGRMITVEKTGREVRSTWEKNVDIELYESDLSYEYEPDSFQVFDGKSYIPDFIVNNEVAIEVKGYVRDYCVAKANKFVEKYDYEYVVIGSDLGVGTHFDIEEVEQAVKYVESVVADTEV